MDRQRGHGQARRRARAHPHPSAGAGAPFLNAEWGVTSIRSLPPDDMSRNGLEEMEVIWAGTSDKSLFLHYEAEGHPLDEEHLRHVHALSASLLDRDDVEHVFAPGFFDPNMSADEVVQFWNAPAEFLSPEQQGNVKPCVPDSSAPTTLHLHPTDLGGRLEQP